MDERRPASAGPLPREERNSEATGLARVVTFLGGHGLTVQDVLDSVEEQPGERCVLFVGSVPAGTSTRLSDADLMVIESVPASAELIVEQNGVAQVVRTMGERLEVCAAYYSPPLFQIIAERIRHALSPIGDPRPDAPLRKMETLDLVLLKFSHRLRTGVTLRGNAESIRESLCLRHLADYLVIHGILEHMIYLEDLQGELENGSIASAAYTFTYSMSYLAGAALATVGETNPDPKWRVRLLERERDRIGHERADGICRYLLGPGSQEPRQWIRDGLKFSAEVIEHCLAARPLARQAVDKVRKAITLSVPEPR